MSLCIYYNISKNKNEEHPENHRRIIETIDYLKTYLLNKKKIPLYDNNTILNYLENELKIGNKEYISNLLLNQIYSSEYMKQIKSTCESLSDDDIIDNDTYFSNLTFNEILDNSIIIYNVCHQIGNGNLKYAYCLIRPPSHHSSVNYFSGFCIVNHTYLCAKYLHDNYKKRILILDYDVHHGDGTQSLV
jgi:acetoin utilization deacetylase AcuC-like enzyme